MGDAKSLLAFKSISEFTRWLADIGSLIGCVPVNGFMGAGKQNEFAARLICTEYLELLWIVQSVSGGGATDLSPNVIRRLRQCSLAAFVIGRVNNVNGRKL